MGGLIKQLAVSLLVSRIFTARILILMITIQLGFFILGAVEILGGFSQFSTGGMFMCTITLYHDKCNQIIKSQSQPIHPSKYFTGEVNVTSGRSERASSGDMLIGTPEAGAAGSSGSIKVSTGFSRKSDSGSITLETGSARYMSDYDTQDSGSISMKVGQSDEGNGGSVMISAGMSLSRKQCKSDWMNLSSLYYSIEILL
jgi:hypothetical protein